MARPGEAELLAPRWRGQPGRIEVWYATLTDPTTGAGYWIHHEMVAPRPSGPARRHGWAAVFPVDGAPEWARFDGPVTVEPGCLWGEAGTIGWELSYEDAGPPLYPFPRWAWERELLPAAQVVVAPTARFRGTITVGDRAAELEGAPGAVSRIYGSGHAERWAWLHADLGEGDALEVVAVVPHRRLLDRLPLLPLVQLRHRGVDWPADPLLAAPRLHARLFDNGFEVAGAWAGRRVQVRVSLDPARCVRIGYEDPDGATATCTNSEVADAEVVVQRRTGRGPWTVERRWDLRGRVHAEIGRRP